MAWSAPAKLNPHTSPCPFIPSLLMPYQSCENSVATRSQMTAFLPAGATEDGDRIGTSDLAQVCSTGCAKSRNPEVHRVAHVSSYVFDSAEKRGYGIQGDARVVAAFLSAVHVGYLHPGNHACQTCS